MTDKNFQLAVQLRHELHAHPELSCEEQWTKQHIMDFIRAHTSTVEVFDRGRWCYAVYHGKEGGKKIGFRADYDALPIDETIDLPYGSQFPGVSHKCGHDGHAATLAAFAVETEERSCDNTIYFIFQHAEEIGAGAKECAVLVDEEGIDEVYGYHNRSGLPLGAVMVKDCCMQCSSMGMSLYFKGKTTHASAPGLGRSSAPAISRIILALPELFRAEDYEGMVLATVIQVDLGEPAFGTAASDGVLRLTIRGSIEKEMYVLRDKINNMAHALACEYGLEFSVDYCDYFPENVNFKESSDKIRAVAAKLGYPVVELEYAESGSEDFGYFTQRTKGAYFNVGSGEDAPDIHTVNYDFNDEVIRPASAVFAELAELKS